MLERKTVYSDRNVEFVTENGYYVIVKKKPKTKVVTRTYAKDQKIKVQGVTVAEWCKKFDIVYSVFDVPAVNGKLLVYTTNGNFSRQVMTMSEQEDFAKIVLNEYKLPYMFYGDIDGFSESGYVMMFGRTIGDEDFESDDFCERMILETSNPKVKYHYYRFDDHEEPESEVDDEIFDKYGLTEDNMKSLYMRNYHSAGHRTFLEFPNWKIIPGSSYSKRGC